MSDRSRAVAVTGIGVLTPIGGDVASFREALFAGRAAFTPLGARMSCAALGARVAGRLADPRWLGLVPSADDDGTGDDPSLEVALIAAREAWHDAGIAALDGLRAMRALVVGSSAAGLVSRSLYESSDPGARRQRLLARSDTAEVTRALARALGIDGPVLTVSTACTSSTNAIAHARDLLLAGHADVVLAGGLDVLVEEIVAGFHAMGAMAAGACAPFSLPVGMSVGEGAGFLVLEREDDARRRGARIRCLIAGAGLAQDGWHATQPSPGGDGVARALQNALADACMTPGQIGWVNAHGTGTEANDTAEWRGIERVFGNGAGVPVSSTKSYFGHALGAAGVLELAATVLALEAQVVLPTLGYTAARGQGPTDVVAEPTPRPCAYESALKSSSGFGGADAALVVRLAEQARPLQVEPASVAAVQARPTPQSNDILLLGGAAVGGFGALSGDALDAFLHAGTVAWSALPSGSRRFAGRVPPLPLARLVRGLDPRSLTALGRHLVVAAQLALDDAGLVLRGATRERVGFFGGAHRIGWDVADAFWGSIRERGFERVSAPAFAHMVLNAPAGMLAEHLGVRGPQTVIGGGRGSALAALALGVAALAERRDADLLLVGSAAELSPGELDALAHCAPDEPVATAPFAVYGHTRATPVFGEGAACVLIGTRAAANAHALSPIATVAATAAAGPGRLALALATALERAGWSPADVDAVYGTADGSVAAAEREVGALSAVLGARLAHVPLCNPTPLVGTSGSLDAFALAAAALALRRGRAHPTAGPTHADLCLDGGSARVKRLLVVCDDSCTGAWAVALAATKRDTEPWQP